MFIPQVRSVFSRTGRGFAVRVCKKGRRQESAPPPFLFSIHLSTKARGDRALATAAVVSRRRPRALTACGTAPRYFATHLRAARRVWARSVEARLTRMELCRSHGPCVSPQTSASSVCLRWPPGRATSAALYGTVRLSTVAHPGYTETRRFQRSVDRIANELTLTTWLSSSYRQSF